MGAEETADETTVTDHYSVTIPAAIREQLAVEPGDKLRWTVDGDGDLSIEVIQQREGVFDDFEPVDAGETNAVEAEREFGTE